MSEGRRKILGVEEGRWIVILGGSIIALVIYIWQDYVSTQRFVIADEKKTNKERYDEQKELWLKSLSIQNQKLSEIQAISINLVGLAKDQKITTSKVKAIEKKMTHMEANVENICDTLETYAVNNEWKKHGCKLKSNR